MQFPDNIIEEKDRIVQGLEITSSTLLGVNTLRFPVSIGNCFSMLANNGKCYRIVNFYKENLEEGIARGKISFPVRLYILGDPAKGGVAVIFDPRIPSNWYNNEFCTSCTPIEFQSFTQRMRRSLSIESGDLTITKTPTGEIHRIGMSDATDWRTDEEKEPIIYASYRPVIKDEESKPIWYMPWVKGP